MAVVTCEDFDVDFVITAFRSCLTDQHVVLLKGYIDAYMEIIKLFRKLGSVFKFVVSDLVDKTGILQRYLSQQPQCYTSVQSMISYEVENNILASPSDKYRPSGCRTLLRLHRALAFIKELLRRLGDASCEAKTAAIASASYDQTLAQYHPWIIRQAVHLGVHTLPNRAGFLSLCHPKDAAPPVAEICLKLEMLVVCIDAVYVKTQALYEQYSLLSLP